MLFYWSETPPGLTEDEDGAWFAEAAYTAAARRGRDEGDGTT